MFCGRLKGFVEDLVNSTMANTLTVVGIRGQVRGIDEK
jgi:hypothetical protein